MKRSRLVSLAFDHARAAVPLVIVAGLAAYTWWLVQSVPGLGGGDRAAPAPTVPDYVLGQATVERFDAQGVRLSVMRGATMTHYLEGDRLVVEQLRLVARDAKGQILNASAREGRYLGLDSTLELAGNARVVASGGQGSLATQGPVSFDGEVLTVNTATRQLRSDRPVLLTSSQGTLRGASLSYDATRGFTTVGGRVSGRLTTARPSAPAASAVSTGPAR
ncbi:MAG: LPS export ABC transporter periplasmic protein LptC [Rubrivivax sp.]|nr:MAG: LPS export ABC transporter periplasmic protein LptC [Rubrivivax sp.]